MVLRGLFPEEIDRDYSQLWVVRLLDCLGYTVTCTCVCICFSGCHKWYDFGQVGGIDGHAGVIHNFCSFTGAYTPNMWSKGGIRKTPRPWRSRQPQQPARKNEKQVCVLGKGCGHLASASEVDLGQFGSFGGASSGRVLTIPPFDHKNPGVHPPLTIFHFCISFFELKMFGSQVSIRSCRYISL